MPDTLSLEGKNVTLHTARGTVMAAHKWSTTEVSGGGATLEGKANPIRSETMEHDQFFLKTPDDREIAVTVTDARLALRTGHDVSVFFGVPAGKEEGPYIAVHNHTTNETVAVESGLQALIGPNPIVWIAIVFGTVLAGIAALGQLWALFGGTSRPIFHIIWLAILSALLYFGVQFILKRRRRKKALGQAVRDMLRKSA